MSIFLLGVNIHGSAINGCQQWQHYCEGRIYRQVMAKELCVIIHFYSNYCFQHSKFCVSVQLLIPVAQHSRMKIITGVSAAPKAVTYSFITWFERSVKPNTFVLALC